MTPRSESYATPKMHIRGCMHHSLSVRASTPTQCIATRCNAPGGGEVEEQEVLEEPSEGRQ
eukprot:9259465-Pyramimonas_sp.AAC.1